MANNNLANRILTFLQDEGFFNRQKDELGEVRQLLGLPLQDSGSVKKSGKLLSIYVDGSADLTKGQAGLGGAFYLDGEEIYAFSEARPGLTNNEAEYGAMIHALELAIEFDVDAIEIFSDSQLMINQMNGSYKVKNERLRPLHRQVMSLLAKRPFIQFSHVYRTENKRADALAKQAMKKAVEEAKQRR